MRPERPSRRRFHRPIELIASMGFSAWVGLAATAAGGCRLVWADRAKYSWSAPLRGQGTPGRRFRFPLKARS